MLVQPASRRPRSASAVRTAVGELPAANDSASAPGFEGVNGRRDAVGGSLAGVDGSVPVVEAPLTRASTSVVMARTERLAGMCRQCRV